MVRDQTQAKPAMLIGLRIVVSFFLFWILHGAKTGLVQAATDFFDYPRRPNFKALLVMAD